MDSATRASYGPAMDRLADYAAGAPSEAVAQVADQILAVAALLGREPGLRRAFVDVARSADDRVELLRTLLRGKIDDDALGPLEALVSARWSRPSELRNAAERLGVDAALAAAERADKLGDVEDELFRFAQVVDGAPRLAAVLGDPGAPYEQRAALVDDLLDGKVQPSTLRLVHVALAGFGGRSFAASLARLVEMAAAARDRQVAYVTSAVPLTDEEVAQLGEHFAQRYGRSISVKETVDPEIIGGLSVQIGSDLYDGTVLRRLTEARAALTR
jgi:F-type H+-transporting ATPase subunit delta